MKEIKKMSAERAAAIQSTFRSASDLYWICPRCKAKITGTREVVMKGCSCAAASPANG